MFDEPVPDLVAERNGLLHHDSGDSVSAGATASVEMVFDVPPSAGKLDVEITPDLLLDSVHRKLNL